MMKNTIKQIILVVLYFLGTFLVIFLGPEDITWFAISVIPLVLAYVLMRLWYNKVAKLFGILIIVEYGGMFIVAYIILPLILNSHY